MGFIKKIYIYTYSVGDIQMYFLYSCNDKWLFSVCEFVIEPLWSVSPERRLTDELYFKQDL